MKSRLANGLVLGFVLAVSSTWAGPGDRLISPGIPRSQPVAAVAPQTDTPNQITFKLYGGFAIVVRGTIGSQDNLSFLVDTGAVPSVLHQRLARKLNLSGPPEDISVVGQNQSVERVALPHIRLGPLEFPSASAVVVDLVPIEKQLGLRLDAIIGLDILGRQDLTIDYRLHQITLGAAIKAGEAIPFELLTKADAPYVVVRLEANSQVVRLLLDTGADSITLFAARLKGRALATQKSGGRKDISAGGEYAVEQVELADVRLGGVKRGKRQATILETAAQSLQDFDGMLGPTALGITRLAFDFRSKILYLQMERSCSENAVGRETDSLQKSKLASKGCLGSASSE